MALSDKPGAQIAHSAERAADPASAAPPAYFDLYELPAPQPDLAAPRAWTCRAVPFAAVPSGDQPPTERVIASYSHVRADRVFVLLGFDFLISNQVDVINCSLGFRGPFDAEDPLALVTRAATDAGICVVVAAGNAGPRDDSMQELALAPWVISVGALGRDGKLLTSSSRGSTTTAGPTVVADGWTRFLTVSALHHSSADSEAWKDLPPQTPGTSFAAPKVTSEVAFIGKMFELAVKYFDCCVDPTESGARMRLPVVGLMDTGLDPDFLMDSDIGPTRRQLLASGKTEVRITPDAGECEWCSKLAAKVPGLALRVTPEAIRRALRLVAEPLDEAPWQIGAGRISRSATIAFLTDLTPSRFIDVLAPDVAGRWSGRERARLDRELGRLWGEEHVYFLEDLFGTGYLLSVARVVR